ncbi:enoyl-CoA hydratase-related protein [Thermodesulfobacteriota bacterium]
MNKSIACNKKGLSVWDKKMPESDWRKLQTNQKGDGKPMGDSIKVEQHKEIDSIRTMIISNQDKRNALTPNILNGISEFLEDPKIRENTRVMVIRGEGDKAFSAGYDISQIRATGGEDGTEASGEILMRAIRNIKTFPAPFISMIKGFCVGAGCHTAVSTDIRVAADDLKIGITPAKLGIVYHEEGIFDFFNLIGPSNTKEIFFTGKLYSAQEAREMGLVNHIVPTADLETFTYELAGQIAQNAPLALKGTKHIVNQWIEAVQLSPDVLEEILTLRQQAFASEDIKEGRQAFAEKRKPVFTGK